MSMKFKQDAAAKAIYKLLAIVVTIMYLQAIVLFIVALYFVALSTVQNNMLAISYFIMSIIIAGIGEYIRNVRAEMVEK